MIVRKFEYRPSRTRTDFDVDFVAEGETFHGVCKDVSDTGVRAEFDEPIEVGASGHLVLRSAGRIIRLEAKVTHSENRRAGLVFTFETPLAREIAANFIASLAGHHSAHDWD